MLKSSIIRLKKPKLFGNRLSAASVNNFISNKCYHNQSSSFSHLQQITLNNKILGFERFIANYRPLFISSQNSNTDTHMNFKLNDEQIDSLLDDLDESLFKIKLTDAVQFSQSLQHLGLNQNIELDSVKRKRMKKMNKHKYKKRRKVSVYFYIIYLFLTLKLGTKS